jgi:hypothetical protein
MPFDWKLIKEKMPRFGSHVDDRLSIDIFSQTVVMPFFKLSIVDNLYDGPHHLSYCVIQAIT